MKAIIKKIFILTLACVMILTSVVGCSSRGKTMIELGDSEISVNLFMLLLSRMKGKLASAYSFGEKALYDSFWDTVMDASTGQTYNDYYTDMVLNNAKTYIAALHLFDDLGLKLPDSYMDTIDKEMDDLLENDGDGSKSALNSLLAPYGANYTVLRDAFIMEAKISYLKDHLFGANGSLIADSLIEEYYQETYVKFRHIFFFTTKPVYDEDANGDTIYFTEDGKIAYDKEKGHKKEEDGKFVTDKNGDMIFYKDDGRIAYDSKNGYPNPVLDASGNVVTTKLTADELIRLSDKAQLIMEDEAKEGDYKLFDALVEKYTEDEGMTKYPNGYYLTATSNYDEPKVVEALFEMEEGEIRIVLDGTYGIHIVMKYELDEGGYADEKNADFFRTSDGSLAFMSTLKNIMLEQYVEKYKADIVVDEKLLSSVSMKTVGANYNY